MTAWDPKAYLRYGDERTRPAIDLVTRIQLDSPQRIVDLGCGPGNSTQILKKRWPSSEILGLDNSAAMIEAAAQQYANQRWQRADIAHWSADAPVDLLFSNATLQWLPNHRQLYHHLCAQVKRGGVLATQIPSDKFAVVRKLIHQVASDPRWASRMETAMNALTMECPSDYYDYLIEFCSSIDLWETEYNHVLPNRPAIIDWMSATGLRPFLAPLNSGERTAFLNELLPRIEANYSVRRDGKVLFPFRRLFLVAYRK